VETAWRFATTTLSFSGSNGHPVQMQVTHPPSEMALKWEYDQGDERLALGAPVARALHAEHDRIGAFSVHRIYRPVRPVDPGMGDRSVVGIMGDTVALWL
jgi:hypothetical protein